VVCPNHITHHDPSEKPVILLTKHVYAIIYPTYKAELQLIPLKLWPASPNEEQPSSFLRLALGFVAQAVPNEFQCSACDNSL